MDPQQPPERQQHDFPLVKFWHKHEWTEKVKEEKGITHAGTDTGHEDDDNEVVDLGNAGIKKPSMPYITDEKGAVIEPWQASIIIGVATDCWKELLDHKDLKAPLSWTRVMPEAKRLYVKRLEETCPEVSYCANHWKAEIIAIRNYPNFKKKFLKDVDAQFPAEVVEALAAGKKRAQSVNGSKSAQGTKRPKLTMLPNPL